MKKILSLILCGLFLNLIYCPMVLAIDDTAVSAPEAQGTAIVSDGNGGLLQQGTTEATVQTQNAPVTSVQNTAQTEMSVQNQPVNTVQQSTGKTEHLVIKKNNSKKINVESVYISSHGVELPAQDILQIAFVSDFNGRKAHVGDTIEFRFPNDIVTQEGTMIIPSTARIIAEITDLKKPKPFHLSGKVYLSFRYIEIDGVRKPLLAKLYSKKDFLSRKTVNSSVAVGETAVATGAGLAAGAAITAATAADAAVLVFGTAITAGLGAIVGAAVGIILPGAAFKAKAGQRVTIQLTQELDL